MWYAATGEAPVAADTAKVRGAVPGLREEEAGGPGIATETLDMYAFSQGFVESGNISYASSMAVLMMIVTNIGFMSLWNRVRP